MARILITAFEPYDRWKANASWLALVELTKEMPKDHEITTRLYPVDFSEVRQRLKNDLDAQYDIALHLGQAPLATCLMLECIGLNVGGHSEQLPEECRTLIEDGPVAYRSQLPLAEWASLLRERGIPAQVSYHAGTFLCNATLYLTHHFIQLHGYKTRATFLHLPLDPSQSTDESQQPPTLSASDAARAIRIVIEQIGKAEPRIKHG